RNIHDLFQKTSCLSVIQAQIGITNLDQLSSPAQTSQRKRGIDPACKDQMKVIENQSSILSKRGQFIDERGQGTCQKRRVWRVQHHERRLAYCGQARSAMPECSYHIAPEARQVVVLLIKREPGNLADTLASPGGEQRRFAKTRSS